MDQPPKTLEAEIALTRTFFLTPSKKDNTGTVSGTTKRGAKRKASCKVHTRRICLGNSGNRVRGATPAGVENVHGTNGQ